VAHGNDLLPLPNLESEVAGSPAKDSIGAIVERMERGDHTTAPDPDEGDAEISRELTGQLATLIVPGQKKAEGASKDFLFKFEIVSTGISSPCKNSFGKTIGTCKQHILEVAVKSFDCTIRLRMISSCLVMRYV
jgi:hypothetical protein